MSYTLQWHHNERDGVSNHQPHDCLLNRLFRRRSNRTSKLRVTGLCAGNSPVTGELPAQKASNTENVSIWWRHPEEWVWGGGGGGGGCGCGCGGGGGVVIVIIYLSAVPYAIQGIFSSGVDSINNIQQHCVRPNCRRQQHWNKHSHWGVTAVSISKKSINQLVWKLKSIIMRICVNIDAWINRCKVTLYCFSVCHATRIGLVE